MTYRKNSLFFSILKKGGYCMGWFCGTCKVSASPSILPPSQGFLFAKKALYTLAIPQHFFFAGERWGQGFTSNSLCSWKWPWTSDFLNCPKKQDAVAIWSKWALCLLLRALTLYCLLLLSSFTGILSLNVRWVITYIGPLEGKSCL